MTRNKTRALTLIETVVTITVCGLIVTIAAPALKTARDQSQVAICLQNLRTLGQAANGYVVENGTFVFVFPFGYHPAEQPTIQFNLVTEFIWGGGVPDTRATDWNPEWGSSPLGSSPDVYQIIPAARPFNAYISPGVWWSDPNRYGVSRPQRYRTPMQLPDYFKCPSDDTCSVPMAGSDPSEPQDPTWRWWGTSYAANWYWAYFYDYGNIVGTLTGPQHQQILNEKLNRGASEFVLFMENPMNFALENAMPGRNPPTSGQTRWVGWHGQTEKHAAAFFDGSARYQYFNTNQIDDPGWSVWPNRPWAGTMWESYQDK
jgi:type II secretory pathway pseudopilin PulG